MPRPTRYRSERHLALVADEVLAKYAQNRDWARALPIPIEDIVETLYELDVVWLELDEPAGVSILGALDPDSKTIIFNERHQGMFVDVLGPYEFTLAHELGHWIFDADDPNQMTFLDGEGDRRFCHSRNSASMTKAQKQRETNANRFAAELLLPRDLVEEVDTDDLVVHIGDFALMWGVSRQALTIRLETLGILVGGPPERGFW